MTQVTADTSYTMLLGGLLVLGMGMGLTMMPILSGALGSLTDHQIARGSTLMNIIQQTAGSIGTAVMSVVLTNHVLNSPAATAYMASPKAPCPPTRCPRPSWPKANRRWPKHSAAPTW
ncbi:hypothetical protein ACFQZ4_36855 [Catellatospora coxensis]|uniref:Major facilitator superfamily (MFS) profile domain-containing protein n=1 Tax=Catellatospora coxensis TaxID=310354 RepID=A0A8J3L9C1_9ACTN|nr:hypothetical protein [Catellatospora coxensis]GIG08640.1 hypothetical protein Cco03nite_53400 [Catellatospora coxensis]